MLGAVLLIFGPHFIPTPPPKGAGARGKDGAQPLPQQQLHPQVTLGLSSPLHIVGLTGPSWPRAGMGPDFPKLRIVGMA